MGPGLNFLVRSKLDGMCQMSNFMILAKCAQFHQNYAPLVPTKYFFLHLDAILKIKHWLIIYVISLSFMIILDDSTFHELEINYEPNGNNETLMTIKFDGTYVTQKSFVFERKTDMQVHAAFFDNQASLGFGTIAYNLLIKDLEYGQY